MQPDRYFSRLARIDIRRDLLGCGFDTVLLDVDNTLRSTADGSIARDARAWLVKCRLAGVKVCLLSNNWHANVFDLAAELELPIVAKAMKPFPPGFISALHTLRSSARQTVMVGDQLLTDVAGAKLLGMHTYLIAPISEDEPAHIAVQRRIERALMGRVPVEEAPVALSSFRDSD